MSQSETILLVILGFAVASLLGLILGWIAWKSALRLGAKRTLRTLPSTVTELQSERDRLRSENAMLTARLELRLTEMKMRMGEQAAEVSRHRNRMQILLTTLSDAENLLAARDSEIAKLQADLQISTVEREELTAQLNKAVAMAIAASEARTIEILPAPSDEMNSPVVNPFALQATSVEPAPPTGAKDPLRRRIQELTRLSEKISRDREQTLTLGPPINPQQVFIKPADSQEVYPETATPGTLDGQVQAAEEASNLLQEELSKLDELWQQSELGLNETATDATTTRQPQAVANVVSLANRIKTLQQSIKP